MAWVVDTCLVIDVLDADPVFGLRTRSLLEKRQPEGLVLCPVSFVELAPTFGGNLERQRLFLLRGGIGCEEDWQPSDTITAHAAWDRLVRRRRSGHGGRRPVADVLIGAFASRFQGLLTRNPADFATAFPTLRIGVP